MSWRCLCVRRVVERGFAQRRLAPWLQPWLWGEIERCASCRSAYEALVRGERLLASGGADANAPSALEFALFSARVVRGVAEPASHRRWLGVGVAGALTATLTVMLALRPSVDEFTARGVASANATSLRVFCQEPVPGGGIRTRPLLSQASSGCPVHATLALAYVAKSPGFLSVHWRSGDRSGWLVRDSPIAAATRPTPLDAELTLETSGTVALTTFASEHEMHRATLDIAARSGKPPEDVSIQTQEIEVLP